MTCNCQTKIDDLQTRLAHLESLLLKPDQKKKEIGSFILVEDGLTLVVSGDTYSHRTAIKSMGGKWNKDKKGWQFSMSDYATVEAWAILFTEESLKFPLEDTEGGFFIGGDTFKVKDTLKTMGAKWDKEKKSWKFPESSREKVEHWIEIMQQP
jgi:hypothetical protein